MHPLLHQRMQRKRKSCNESDTLPQNIFPENHPDFKKYALEVFQTFENTGKTLLRAIALYLGLDEFYFYRLKWDFTLGLLGLALAVDTQVIYISLVEHYKPNFKLFPQKGTKHTSGG